jgi:hypothetical protein
VQEEYDHLGGYALENQAHELLLGLGFDNERIAPREGAGQDREALLHLMELARVAGDPQASRLRPTP